MEDEHCDKQLRAVFDYFDQDGTGKLEVHELEQVMNALGQCLTREELEEIMREEDINFDGAMDLDEFITFFKKHGKDGNKVSNEIKRAFELFDRKKQKYLTEADLELVLTKIGAFPFTKEEASLCFKAFDANGDGKMDYNEFANFLCAMCPDFGDLKSLNKRQ